MRDCDVVLILKQEDAGAGEIALTPGISSESPAPAGPPFLTRERRTPSRFRSRSDTYAGSSGRTARPRRRSRSLPLPSSTPGPSVSAPQERPGVAPSPPTASPKHRIHLLRVYLASCRSSCACRRAAPAGSRPSCSSGAAASASAMGFEGRDQWAEARVSRPGSLGERSEIVMYVKQVALRRQRRRVYRPAAALAPPSRARLRADPNAAVPMRDFVADWNKWSPAERVLAVMVILLMVALPAGLLMTG